MAKGDNEAKADSATKQGAAAIADPTTIPTLEQRKRDKGLPIHIDRERLAALGVVTFLKIEPSEATNPSTQKVEPGLLTTVQSDDGNTYTVLIANMVLSKDLEAVDLPFRAKIVKHGRTWVFTS